MTDISTDVPSGDSVTLIVRLRDAILEHVNDPVILCSLIAEAADVLELRESERSKDLEDARGVLAEVEELAALRASAASGLFAPKEDEVCLAMNHLSDFKRGNLTTLTEENAAVALGEITRLHSLVATCATRGSASRSESRGLGSDALLSAIARAVTAWERDELPEDAHGPVDEPFECDAHYLEYVGRLARAALAGGRGLGSASALEVEAGERLKAIRERAQAVAYMEADTSEPVEEFVVRLLGMSGPGVDWSSVTGFTRDEAEFIAHAFTDIPWLIPLASATKPEASPSPEKSLKLGDEQSSSCGGEKL